MQHTLSLSLGAPMWRSLAGMALALFAGIAAAVPVSSFTINVPQRSPKMEVAALKITLQLDSSANIALQVSEAASGTLTTQDMVLTTNTNDCFAGAVCFANLPNQPAGAVQSDRVTVIKPMQLGADPASSANNKVVVLLRLRSNLNEAGSCASTMNAAETWTVSVVGGAARITGVSVQSLDKNTVGIGGANPVCGTSYRPIPLNDGPLATVTGQAQALAGGRVGVDAVMVLDRSGSMSELVSNVGGAPTKMVRLGQATDTFIDMWAALRANECTNFAVNCPAIGGNPGIQAPTDRLGVVFFDDNFNWLETLRPLSSIDGLKDFSTLNLATEKTQIKAVGPSGWTSIGGGLNLAAPALAPAASEPNRKVILLMTDGYQNTQPLVGVNGSQVQLDSGCGTPPCALANQPPIQIYGVTVGTGVAVDPTVNQQVASASGGFYFNTEDDASILPNLFVQVLQNAIKFSSVETLRIVKGRTRFSAPFTTQVPVTTGTQSLAFNLNWQGTLGALRVRLAPPGGGTPIDFVPGTVSTPGVLVGNVTFPRQDVPITAGLWTVTVTPVGDIDRDIPFDFSLLGDDNTVNSSLATVTVMPVVGGSIKLTAQVNDLDKALLGLGAQPGAQVQVFVARPRVNLGDLLSDSAAQPVPAGATDPGSAAQRKLAAILQANPSALVTANDILSLRDDGSAASGDSAANDGTYSALVQADVEGHYNFVFLVQGTAESGGAFVRQAIRTVHVRSMPDSSNMQYTTQIVGGGDLARALSVTMTPRNVKGSKMGPGYANYFWFSALGRPPVKPVDNLNGTYTAVIPFSGTTPPNVAVHFLDQPLKRPDSFVPKPGDLNSSNTVTPVVGGGSGRYAIWGGLGVATPHGSFSNTHGSGLAATLGFEFVYSPSLSAEATLGTHRFSGEGAAPDIDATVLGFNAKWYFTPQPMRFFATAGLGVYDFNPGSTKAGVTVGAGAQFQLSPEWSLEARYGLHTLGGNSPFTTHSTLQLAARYAF